jgi:hypothetical protein
MHYRWFSIRNRMEQRLAAVRNDSVLRWPQRCCGELREVIL